MQPFLSLKCTSLDSDTKVRERLIHGRNSLSLELLVQSNKKQIKFQSLSLLFLLFFEAMHHPCLNAGYLTSRVTMPHPPYVKVTRYILSNFFLLESFINSQSVLPSKSFPGQFFQEFQFAVNGKPLAFAQLTVWSFQKVTALSYQSPWHSSPHGRGRSPHPHPTFGRWEHLSSSVSNILYIEFHFTTIWLIYNEIMYIYKCKIYIFQFWLAHKKGKICFLLFNFY